MGVRGDQGRNASRARERLSKTLPENAWSQFSKPERRSKVQISEASVDVVLSKPRFGATGSVSEEIARLKARKRPGPPPEGLEWVREMLRSVTVSNEDRDTVQRVLTDAPSLLHQAQDSPEQPAENPASPTRKLSPLRRMFNRVSQSPTRKQQLPTSPTKRGGSLPSLLQGLHDQPQMPVGGEGMYRDEVWRCLEPYMKVWAVRVLRGLWVNEVQPYREKVKALSSEKQALRDKVYDSQRAYLRDVTELRTRGKQDFQWDEPPLFYEATSYLEERDQKLVRDIVRERVRLALSRGPDRQLLDSYEEQVQELTKKHAEAAQQLEESEERALTLEEELQKLRLAPRGSPPARRGAQEDPKLRDAALELAQALREQEKLQQAVERLKAQEADDAEAKRFLEQRCQELKEEVDRLRSGQCATPTKAVWKPGSPCRAPNRELQRAADEVRFQTREKAMRRDLEERDKDLLRLKEELTRRQNEWARERLALKREAAEGGKAEGPPLAASPSNFAADASRPASRRSAGRPGTSHSLRPASACGVSPDLGVCAEPAPEPLAREALAAAIAAIAEDDEALDDLPPLADPGVNVDELRALVQKQHKELQMQRRTIRSQAKELEQNKTDIEAKDKEIAQLKVTLGELMHRLAQFEEKFKQMGLGAQCRQVMKEMGFTQVLARAGYGLVFERLYADALRRQQKLRELRDQMRRMESTGFVRKMQDLLNLVEHVLSPGQVSITFDGKQRPGHPMRATCDASDFRRAAPDGHEFRHKQLSDGVLKESRSSDHFKAGFTDRLDAGPSRGAAPFDPRDKGTAGKDAARLRSGPLSRSPPSGPLLASRPLCPAARPSLSLPHLD